VAGFDLRFGALGVINRHAAHQRAHGINHLRGFARSDNQLVLLALLYIAADARQLFQLWEIESGFILHLDPHAGHAVFQPQDVFLSANPLQDTAGERCRFFHIRLFSFLTPPVKNHCAGQDELAPSLHPARLKSSEWPV
jgi:hypothetical protein